MIVSVLDRGAKGDGITDDTAAIQDACTNSSDGDQILFPAGYRFRIGPPGINVPGARDLELSGAVVELLPNPPARSFAFQTIPGAANIRMIGGTLIGEPSRVVVGGHRIGFRGDSVEGCEIIGTQFVGWKTDGLWFGGNLGSSKIRVVDVTCDTFGRNGLSIVNATNIVVDRCVFKNAALGTQPGAGVDVEPNPGDRVADITIHDCTAIDCEVGFYLHPGRGLPGDGFRVYRCHVTRARRIGIVVNSARGVSVMGNTVEMAPHVLPASLPIGISIGGATLPTVARDVVCAGNEISGAVRALVFAGVDALKATGNKVGPGGTIGIVGLGVVGDAFLAGNA